ncbi:hypothetical protein Q7P37_002196 [Cladosporium fusiforme]
MVSSTPVSPSMPTYSPLPGVPKDYESSFLVSDTMTAARAKAAATGHNPEPLPLPNPTPWSMDPNECIDAAIAKSEALVAEARVQLAAPIVAPPELTEEEQHELDRNAVWDRLSAERDKINDHSLERNQALYESVMATIDRMEADGAPIPDCSDLLTWESNAGYAGVKKGEKKKAQQMRKAKAATVSSSEDKQITQHVSVQKKRNRNPADGGQLWQNIFKFEFRFSW